MAGGGLANAADLDGLGLDGGGDGRIPRFKKPDSVYHQLGVLRTLAEVDCWI